MENKRKILIILLILILSALILLFIDMNKYKEYTKDYFYMDTYINIKVNTTKNKKDMDKIFEDIDYLYDTYHKLTDRYNSYDGVINVYYLNEVLKDNESITIDRRLTTIISLGINYYNETSGLFNIASGNLTEVWKNFIDRCDTLPTEEELDVNINIEDISIEKDVYTKRGGIKLDLGGVAKGYVTELAANYLEENNINSYIINAGGNVKVGKPHNKDNYIIGITDPENTEDIFTKVNVSKESVVTSGNYQRYCILDNTNYSHIINPITKHPSTYAKSVTVVGENSSILDIYSTYLYLLPVDKGLEVVNSNPDIEAIWYIDKDNIIRSDGFNYE